MNSIPRITFPASLDLYEPIATDDPAAEGISTDFADQMLKTMMRIAKENMRTRQSAETSAEETLTGLQRQEDVFLQLKKQRQELEDRQEILVRFAIELIDLLDGFIRAASAGSDAGLVSVAKTMSNTLEPLLQRTGCLRIPAAGEVPDAIYHYVLDTRTVEEKSDKDRVVEVVREGFTLNGIVVRKADVIVGR
ncbi:nucleotide exchange factor GrpE [bacterium]|nr:nucleotide exchange factor GrpE [bacterium]